MSLHSRCCRSFARSLARAHSHGGALRGSFDLPLFYSALVVFECADAACACGPPNNPLSSSRCPRRLPPVHGAVLPKTVEAASGFMLVRAADAAII